MIGAIVAGGLSEPVAPVFGAWESIETYTVGSGGQSSITFGSGGTIPQTYKHLQLRVAVRTNRSGGDDSVSVRFNGDTGSNYTWHGLYGTGSGTPGAQASTSQTAATILGEVLSDTQLANTFTVGIVDILDYTNTSKNTTLRSLNGVDGNGYGQMRLHSGLWLNTSAITSLTVKPDYGTLFVQHSSLALYGIKG